MLAEVVIGCNNIANPVLVQRPNPWLSSALGSMSLVKPGKSINGETASQQGRRRPLKCLPHTYLFVTKLESTLVFVDTVLRYATPFIKWMGKLYLRNDDGSYHDLESPARIG